MKHDDAIRYAAQALGHLTTPDYAHTLAADPCDNERAHLRKARDYLSIASAHCQQAIERITAREVAAKRKTLCPNPNCGKPVAHEGDCRAPA